LHERVERARAEPALLCEHMTLGERLDEGQNEGVAEQLECERLGRRRIGEVD
jgi:hypothetical protein